MIAVFLIIPYILLIIFLTKRALSWLSACSARFSGRPGRIAVISLCVFVASVPALGFLLPSSGLQRFLQEFSNFWLGVILYTLLTMAVYYIIRIILRITRKIPVSRPLEGKRLAAAGTLMLGIVLAVCIYGTMHCSDLQKASYKVSINKPGTDITVVLISDLHMGYNTNVSDLKKDVAAINSMDPDVVCIAGDIFNNDYDAMEHPDQLEAAFRKIRSRYGVYASYGNHDVSEPLLCGFTFNGGRHPVSDPRMDLFLKRAGIRLLQDRSVMIADDFYLTGRRDDDKPGRGALKRKSASQLLSSMDKTKPIIVMDHSPADLAGLSEAGCDLDLSGHTHDGQVFPSNILSRIIWKNSYGRLKVGNMTSIVSSGAGTFGPCMRIGTDSEIVKIDVKFKQ